MRYGNASTILFGFRSIGKKTLYGQLRRYLGEVFRKLARQKESEVVEGHLMLDHVHMLISVPPKYAVAQVVGFMKGKKRYSHC